MSVRDLSVSVAPGTVPPWLRDAAVVAAAIQVKSAEQLLEVAGGDEVVLTRHQATLLDRASVR